MPEYRVAEIPLDKITWSQQERKSFDRVSLAMLTETIRTQGVAHAITVIEHGDQYEGIIGQRRFLASIAAGRTTIPARIREKPNSEAEAIELRLCENVARESLNPMELAHGIQHLMNASGLNATQIAGRIGMSVSQVSKSVQLLRLPEAITKEIQSGRISGAAGYALSQVEDTSQQAEMARKVIAGELDRDSISGATKRSTKPPTASASQNSTRIAATLGSGRTIVLTGPGVTSLDVMIQWLQELLAKARKARPRGLEVATFVRMMKDQAKNPINDKVAAGKESNL